MVSGAGLASMSLRAVGPGAVRVGKFIGRVGVVSLPAIGVGLDLDERVVRKHVAKLESLGWLMRAPWQWGDGSIVWLTGAGIDGVGLHGVRPVTVKSTHSTPGMSTIMRGVQVGFTAARMERRGFEWLSARELAVDQSRWAVAHRRDYGLVTQLPDIAAWVPGMQKPVAIVCEETRRRDDRQTWRLEGWRDAIIAGRYDSVQYDCAHEHLATWIQKLGKKIRFARPELRCVVQTPAEKIPTLGPYEPSPEPTPEPESVQREPVEQQPVRDPAPSIYAREPLEKWAPEPETPEEYERRKELYRELMGHYDNFEPPEKPKRHWFG
jgi:hypothetical protein